MKKLNFSLFMLFVLVGCSTPKTRIAERQSYLDRSLASDLPCLDSIKEFFAPLNVARAGFDWPDDFQIADLGKLQVYITNNLKEQMTWKQKDSVALGSVEWVGQKELKYIPGQIDIVERFSQSSLLYHKKYSRNASSVLIWTYLNLGMDQGVKRIKESDKIKRIAKINESFKLAATQSDDQISQEGILPLIKELKTIIQDMKSNPLKMVNAYTDKDKEDIMANIIHPTVEMFQDYNQISGKSAVEDTKALYQFFTSNMHLAEEQGVRVWYEERASRVKNLDSILNFSEMNLTNGKFSSIEASMISSSLDLIIL